MASWMMWLKWRFGFRTFTTERPGIVFNVFRRECSLSPLSQNRPVQANNKKIKMKIAIRFILPIRIGDLKMEIGASV